MSDINWNPSIKQDIAWKHLESKKKELFYMAVQLEEEKVILAVDGKFIGV